MSELVWKLVSDEKPPEGVPVLALHLNQFSNADWTFSWPDVLIRTHERGYDSYGLFSEPYMWALIDLPPVPECAERTRAKRIGEEEARRRAAIEQVERSTDEAIKRIEREPLGVFVR